MRRVANQTSSPVFGLRFLTNEELRASVVGCLGGPTVEVNRAAASLTIRLCGDGGDTDSAPADDAVYSELR
jgi:hypothetical protein